MRTLILFRHGKSDWDAAYDRDHDRPLAARGREAARIMGRTLTRLGQVPALAVSSSALRARETLHLAARAGHWHCPLKIDEALYETSPQGVLAWLSELGEEPGCVLLTGHEPTWSTLAGRLIGDANIRVPTGSMLRIDLAIDAWREVDFGRGQLRWLLPPKVVGRLEVVR